MFSRQCWLLLCYWALVCLIDHSPAYAAEVSPVFTHQSPAGVVFTVTPDGLTSVKTAERQIASGTWSVFNGEVWFKDSGTKAVRVPNPAEKSLVQISPRQAKVRHVAGDVVATYDYSFDGEDVLISTRIENNHAESPLNVVGFSGLTFLFDVLPQGLMQNQHISYFQAHGLSLCHPGHWSPIGGSYATDNTIGVGVSPWNTGLSRTLILWDYTDWNPGKRENLPQRRLIYFANTPVPARGSATIDMKLRVSPNRDWKHLLDPYRQHFQKTFGPVQYKTDARVITTDYLNHSQKVVGPTNLYGFHGGHRRIDTEAGAKLFCDTHLAALKSAGGQGVIVWGQGGDDPRGGMYRPDFDILPPEVAANWPTIAERFKESGMKLGVTTRPRDMAVRLDWKQDQIIAINATDPDHRAMLWRRFDNMNKKGCTLYYLDSFGDSFEDVLLMRFLRQKLGPDILTFAEHQCDAMLVYSGGYSETTFSADNGKPAYRLWSGLRNWEIYQWLAPGSQLSARLYEVKGKIPDDFERPDRYYFRNRITPLLPLPDSRVSGLKAIEGEFVDEKGNWK